MIDRIIILRSAVLGDFIISSPAINFIREKHSDAKIYLFTIQSVHEKDRKAVKVYETKKTLPWLDFLEKKVVDEIIPMESVDLSYIFRVLRPKVKRIRPTKCYILTDPLVNWKGNIAKLLFIKFLGADCPVYGWKDYIKNKNEKFAAREEKRCVNHTLSCLESVFEDKTIIDKEIVVKFPIVVSEQGKNEAENIWNKYDFYNKRVYIISAGGIKPHKVWPVEKYIEVCRFILSDKNAEIILTGTNKDLGIGQRIEAVCKSAKVHNMIGKTSLMVLAGLLQKAYMLIGNDGGTMHIGDAVGCTVVAVMPGLELPRTVEPWHNMNNSLRIGVKCTPCYDFDDCPNKTYICMRDIEVERVIDAITKAKKKQMPYNAVRVSINREGKLPLLRIVDGL